MLKDCGRNLGQRAWTHVTGRTLPPGVRVLCPVRGATMAHLVSSVAKIAESAGLIVK